MSAVVSDQYEIMEMSLPSMWGNYRSAMDECLRFHEAGDRESSLFYLAVVKVTLDIYFEAVEREMECRGV